jgi:hypothetical protein
MTNVIDFPQQAQAIVDKIETHIETARAELGNAGFASAVGETALSLESLAIVAEHVQAACEALEQAR